MARLVKDGVGLDYEERGAGDPPVLLVHGILCDRRYVAPQFEYFSRSHRTIAVDLRGHGLSDVPQQGYTVDGLADDLAWVSAQLELVRPLVIGPAWEESSPWPLPRTIPTSSARLSPSIRCSSLETPGRQR